MNIAVLIKQVPETDNLIIDEETGTVKRTGVETIVNPLDLYALEAALRIKEENGNSTVHVVSMGPPSAEKALREALSMGADTAALVSDKTFAGSDTFATSYILSEALKTSGHFDLILCGEKAVDGDTGQVGPELAAFLDIDVVSFVSDIEFKDGFYIFKRMTEYGIDVIKVSPPVSATVTKAIGEPRLPTLSGKKRARIERIQKLDAGQMHINPDDVGLNGSPTRVVKIKKPSLKRNPVIFSPSTEDEMHSTAEKLIDYLAERNLLQQEEI